MAHTHDPDTLSYETGHVLHDAVRSRSPPRVVAPLTGAAGSYIANAARSYDAVRSLGRAPTRGAIIYGAARLRKPSLDPSTPASAAKPSSTEGA